MSRSVLALPLVLLMAAAPVSAVAQTRIAPAPRSGTPAPPALGPTANDPLAPNNAPDTTSTSGGRDWTLPIIFGSLALALLLLVIADWIRNRRRDAAVATSGAPRPPRPKPATRTGPLPSQRPSETRRRRAAGKRSSRRGRS